MWGDTLPKDACGVCYGNNQTCIGGCDKQPYSNKTFDTCGVCGGDSSSCAATVAKTKLNSSVIAGAVVGSVLGILVIAGAIVGFYIRRRKMFSKYDESTQMTTYADMPTNNSNYSFMASSSTTSKRAFKCEIDNF